MKSQIKHPISPMDALLAQEIPTGKGLLYEPKWDGFRWQKLRNG
jgi:ATP-dependent DNA ligase